MTCTTIDASFSIRDRIPVGFSASPAVLACMLSAATTLGQCPPSDHNCFSEGGPGCTSFKCCVNVCSVDSFCCEIEWDGLCVEQAIAMCDGCGDPNAGDCCAADATPFCDDRSCCEAVCAIDPFCCTDDWDSICVDEAENELLCGCFADACPNPDHNCFEEGAAGCNDTACCVAVCSIDSFCCEVMWDSTCVSEATAFCFGCGDPAAGSCFIKQVGPFCNDGSCCADVCSIDSFCCETLWDGICVSEAVELCGDAACVAATHNCGTEGDPGCDDLLCCNIACEIDPLCCDESWDSKCVELAVDACEGGCGFANAGSCFSVGNEPYCNNRACCETVCAIDPFCCGGAWDAMCAGEAIELCCPTDIFPANGVNGCGGGDGTTEAGDLAELLAAWGPCAACCADLSPPGAPDGVVGPADLASLLASWGECP